MEQWNSALLCLELSVALCVFRAPNLSGHCSNLRAEAKKREGVRWAVCDKWLLWAKICGALVYNGNIMYHKFNLHFSDSQITFNPIRQSLLCWLKRHSQANSFAAAATLLSSSPTLSHPHFSDSTSFPPLVGHSYLFYYSPSVFSFHPLLLHFYRQWESHNAELTVCKCPFCAQCLHTDNCTFWQDCDFRMVYTYL